VGSRRSLAVWCAVGSFILAGALAGCTAGQSQEAAPLPPVNPLLTQRPLGPQPGEIAVPGTRQLPPRLGPFAPRTSKQPNIVLVLMDDFSMDLLRTMASAREMRRRGASYTSAFVDDSLCCVSRSSLFTGQYPFQTRVFGNTPNLPNPHGPVGGWEAFSGNGDPKRSFNLVLQRAGYRTGFIGKYLNGYEYILSRAFLPPVPPGWDDFRAVFGTAYDEFGFTMTRTQHGTVSAHIVPKAPQLAPVKEKDSQYAGNVIAASALQYIKAHERFGAPYFLEVAPYAPHQSVPGEYAIPLTRTYPDSPQFPAAFRDRAPLDDPTGGNCGLVDCGDLTTRDLHGFGHPGSFNQPRYADGTLAPPWRNWTHQLTPGKAETLLRDRARMVQTIDRMMRRILAAVGPNTYVVLTSDNGFHLGQEQLLVGKGTPYDTDTHVPLLVVGPRVRPGPRADLVENIDLAPTFEEWAGARSPAYVSGDSLVPTLEKPRLTPHRYVFFQHTWASYHVQDPDIPGPRAMMAWIPTYVAVRSQDQLLVRLDLDNGDGTDYAYEFYDYRDTPWEKVNQFGWPDKQADVARLMEKLDEWDACTTTVGPQPVSASCRELRSETVAR
jgi:N-acetylglucosamine-6-sulfatase